MVLVHRSSGFLLTSSLSTDIIAIQRRPGSLKGQLKHAETVEKNVLPTKEEIEAERRASVSEEGEKE